MVAHYYSSFYINLKNAGMDDNSGWIYIQKGKECAMDDVQKDGTKNIEECAIACWGLSSLFVFDDDCFGSICGCYCEIGAHPNGTCPLKSATFYNLYKYVQSKHGSNHNPRNNRKI